MSALYREIIIGATAYSASGPQLSTIAPGASGTTWWQGDYLKGWEPSFHQYRCLGPSGADVYVSFDGINDHGRVAAAGAAGVLLPNTLQASYKNAWLRSVQGVTGSIGCGLYSR